MSERPIGLRRALFSARLGAWLGYAALLALAGSSPGPGSAAFGLLPALSSASGLGAIGGLAVGLAAALADAAAQALRGNPLPDLGRVLTWVLVAGAASITGALHHHERARLAGLAYLDPLTSLPNRRAFYERAEETIAAAQRSKAASDRIRAFMAIDLDDFRSVNDSLGHRRGDRVLAEAARRLVGAVRRSDLIFRVGSDDFQVVLTSTSHEEDAAVAAEKILRALTQPFRIDDITVYLGASLGIALYPRDGTDATSLARAAESALHEAKRDRNTYRFFAAAMQDRAAERMSMLSGLRKAVERGEFLLEYQPICARDGSLAGAEALLRWTPEGTEPVAPDRFIHLAEESGLILPIGRWVLERAAQDLELFAQAGLKHVPLSINISAKQLRDRGFPGYLRGLLARTGLDPARLRLEITESCLMENTEETLRRIDELHKAGLAFSIDDFGTGYSNLAYLELLPVDELKIDRCFTTALPGDPAARAIVAAVIQLAEGLGRRVVAEGVDSAERHEYLQAAGIHLAQGEYFSMPLPVEGFIRRYGEPEPPAHAAAVPKAARSLDGAGA